MSSRIVVYAAFVAVIFLAGVGQVGAEVSTDPFAIHIDTLFNKVDYGPCNIAFFGDTAWNPASYSERLCTPHGRRVGGVEGASLCHFKIIDPDDGCLLWNGRLTGEGSATGDLNLDFSVPIGVELSSFEFSDSSDYTGQTVLYHRSGFALTPGETYTIQITEQVSGCLPEPDQEKIRVTASVAIPDCCGYYNSGYSGNTNCDELGKVNLSDINRLIDFVYQNGADLCCHENGNVDGDAEGKVNAADITRLIDHVYVSKDPTEPCL